MKRKRWRHKIRLGTDNTRMPAWKFSSTPGGRCFAHVALDDSSILYVIGVNPLPIVSGDAQVFKLACVADDSSSNWEREWPRKVPCLPFGQHISRCSTRVGTDFGHGCQFEIRLVRVEYLNNCT